MKQELPITFDTKIVIRYADTKEVLREGKNAIHPQNMSRVIARALANEPNALIHRIAFGNGGTYTDAAGNVVFNPPNDGNSGGWEARLYNETYSEIVDELHPDFKNDPGSADVNNVRMAGGASPSDDPEGGGVTSVEVGRKSNIVVTMVINENEPSGQLLDQNVGPLVEEDETYFMFDEIGLYSPGRPAKSTSGYSTVNVGTAKTSTSTTNLAPNTNYTLPMIVNGFIRSATVRTPSSGTGAAGSFTYGDICEGINSGSWIVGGDPLDNYVTVYITDRSGGAYPSILGMQSYGFLTFESKLTGINSRVELTCDASGTNFFNVLTNAVCGNVNVNSIIGVAAGAANDPVNPDNERERLLTHFIFDPILKSRDRAIEIEYTLTVSVGRTADSQVIQISGTPGPSPTPTPTPTVTPTVTPTPSATPTVPAPVVLHVYLGNGELYTPGPFSYAVRAVAVNDEVTEESAYIHIHGLPEDAVADDYRFALDTWVMTDGDLAAGNSFYAGGDFAGDYQSTIGNDPFESAAWDTDAGNGVRLDGLTRISAGMATAGGPAIGSGTVMLRLFDIDDVEVASKELTWEYNYTAF